MMNDPAHTQYLAEQITKLVVGVAFALAALYVGFRKKPPK